MSSGIGASLIPLTNGTNASATDVDTNLQNINNGGVSNDSGNITTDGNGMMTVKKLGIALGNTTTPSEVTVGVAFGVINNAGSRMMELKANSNLIIGGSQYQTSTSGTPTLVGSQGFDSFDYAEVYPCDAFYDNGTVVCLSDNGLLTRCTHDACPCAMIVSLNPGFILGGNQVEERRGILPIALCGRVAVNTPDVITPRLFVCSNGQGGVRAITARETAYALGFALSATHAGQVGIYLRTGMYTQP